MLTRSSSANGGALSGRYAIPKAALHCFELHSEAMFALSEITPL
jgi:hypothetical protein